MNHMDLRARNQSFFVGKGLDIGPFDKPFITNPAGQGLTVETVDRWSPEDLKRLFPEIGNSTVPQPTYVADVSANGLSFSSSENYDFVICSHVAEHVANPLGLIHECYRVLKQGGVLYISVPDGRYSDDQGRTLTCYEYLLHLYCNNVTDIPDGRVMDYLTSPRVFTGWVKDVIERNAVTKEILDNERLRSFHVHVWDSSSFIQHFKQFSNYAGLNWELIDLFVWENNLYEAVLIVRKTSASSREEFEAKVDVRLQQRIQEGQDIRDIWPYFRLSLARLRAWINRIFA